MTKSARKYHPVVEAWVVGAGSLYDILRDPPDPGHPLVKAMKRVRDRKLGAGDIGNEEMFQTLEAVSLEGADRELVMLFLFFWLSASHTEGRATEVGALAARMEAMATADLPPELTMLAAAARGLHFAQLGDTVRSREYAERAIRMLPRSSPRYRINMASYMMNLAVNGLAGPLEDELADFRKGLIGRQSAFGALVGFIHCLEMCRPEEALEFLLEVRRDPTEVALHAGALEDSTAVVMAMQGQAPDEQAGASCAPAAVVAHLLARRPDAALRAVRIQAEKDAEFFVKRSNFESFGLLRAELGSGHGEAARRVLDRRREIGNVHPYMNDLLLARIELLAGRREEAARRFAAAWRSAEHYRALTRLEFELRLACELTAADGLWLARAVQEKLAGDAPRGMPTSGRPAQDPTAPSAPAAGRGLARLAGTSPVMERVRELVGRFAPLDVPVLILGETGTGKELAARALHESGPRAGEPFVAVNCGSITASLLESELFGHDRGAFTGAVRARRGLFEEAGRGTILLDEIGDMPLELQAALLRVLETGEVRPVGSSRSRKVACRVLAATNADLEERVRAGAFRQDLFYRLARLEIRLTPLRERRRDILPLAERFLAEGRSDGLVPTLAPELRAALEGGDWPGNARELRNAVERMRLVNSDKLHYELADFKVAPEAGAEGSADGTASSGGAGRRSVSPSGGPGGALNPRSAFRRLDRLRAAFREHRKLGRAEAARLLGVSLPTATRDLRALCSAGLIRKVMPGASPASHYFEMREEEQ